MLLVVKNKAAVSATRISEFVVAGHETHEVTLGATREIVAESKTHEAEVGGTHELVVAGGKTREAGVSE